MTMKPFKASSVVLDDFVQKMKSKGKKRVKIGYPKGKLADVSDLQKAIRNNYGIGVPRRPFFDNAKIKIEKEWKKLVQAKLNKDTDIEKLLNLIGVKGVAIIQNEIRDGNYLPNSPETVARKKSDHPLIDTGDMRLAVTYMLEG